MSEIQPLPLYTSRSAIETRHKCLRERYLGYDAPIIEGGKPTGIVRQGSKYEAKFGQILHTAMAACLVQGKLEEQFLEIYLDRLTDVVHDCFGDLEPEILEYTVAEQRTLLRSLVTHWCHLHLNKILSEFEVLSVEVEQNIVFKPEDYLAPNVLALYNPPLRPIKLGFRADAVLKRRSDGAIIILDFKTTKYASEDWAINLDGSLQSNLYIAAAEQHLEQYVSGIMYAGMVKGKREMDAALSSPYKGRVIQYGSYLYGWKGKDGTVYKDYVKGRTRNYMGFQTVDALRELGWPMQAFFPITVPWKPIGIDGVVGQQIIAENEYAKKVAMVNADRSLADLVFEQSFSSCFKYGSKYACQFKAICHDGMHPAEVGNHYEPRVDHHGEEV
jgi:hypothetical protein